jgi:hypothetical protein
VNGIINRESEETAHDPTKEPEKEGGLSWRALPIDEPHVDQRKSGTRHEKSGIKEPGGI